VFSLPGSQMGRLLVLALVAAAAGYVVSASAGRGATLAGPRMPASAGMRAAATTVHDCRVPKLDFVSPETTTQTNQNNVWVPVTGLSTTIHVGGTTRSCVIVEVGGLAWAQQATDETLQVLLDGAATASPPYDYFAASDFTNAPAHVRSGEFIFSNVAPGNHTISAQISTCCGPTYTVYLTWPTMQILHK
jgi:hypothetical protein